MFHSNIVSTFLLSIGKLWFTDNSSKGNSDRAHNTQIGQEKCKTLSQLMTYISASFIIPSLLVRLVSIHSESASCTHLTCH